MGRDDSDDDGQVSSEEEEEGAGLVDAGGIFKHKVGGWVRRVC